MAVVCTRSNLCTSLIKSPVRSPMCPRDTVSFSPKLVQNILQKIHIDGSKNDPKGFVSNYGHSGWKKNCHSVAFNNVFFWDQSDFYCPGRNCSWLLHIGNLMSWLWKYQTLIIGWAVTDCTHLWNDAVILELLLQQSVFLLQCLNLIKSILTNIAVFVKFWESTWLERRSFSAEMPWWTKGVLIGF